MESLFGTVYPKAFHRAPPARTAPAANVAVRLADA